MPLRPSRLCLAFVMKIPVKIGGPGGKEDLDARGLDGTKKGGSSRRDQRCDERISPEIHMVLVLK